MHGRPCMGVCSMGVNAGPTILLHGVGISFIIIRKVPDTGTRLGAM